MSLRAWCPSTKEQGFAGREAPRRTGGRDIRVALLVRPGPAPRRSAAGWHQKAELLQQLRDIIILSDENRDSISENPSRIGLVREIHEGVLFGIVRNGSVQWIPDDISGFSNQLRQHIFRKTVVHIRPDGEGLKAVTAIRRQLVDCGGQGLGEYLFSDNQNLTVRDIPAFVRRIALPEADSFGISFFLCQ